jgi:hypothetical protein
VHVYVDGVFAAQVLTSEPRGDVQRAVAGAGPATGYSWSQVLAPGVHQVCAYAINAGFGTSNPQLGCRTVTAIGGSAANPIGSFDGVSGGPGTLTAGGWAYDVDAPAGAVSVHVYVDDAFAGSTQADLSRPDVGRAISGAGDQHGFSWSGTATPGNHRVCVYAINMGAGGGNPGLGCRTVSVTDPSIGRSPTGSLDGVTPSAGAVTLGGWAYDADAPTQAVPVHVYLDGVFLTAILAGDPRPDIGAAYPGAGPLHGFNAAASVASGRHQICTYAINIGQGNAGNPQLGCRTVTVP